MNTDTSDSRVSYPKDTAGKKEAWWARAAAPGSSHWTSGRFDDGDENVLSLSFPEPQLQGSRNWLWWVWVTSSGRGRPSGVAWHPSVVTGSWEPGAACPSRRAGGSSVGCTRSSGPAPDFYVLRPASLVKYHLAGSLIKWFLRWKNSSEIEKTFGLPQATGFRWENARPVPVGPGILDHIFPGGWKACFSPILTRVAVCWIFQRVMMVFKSCCNSSVFVAKHPCPPCQM